MPPSAARNDDSVISSGSNNIANSSLQRSGLAATVGDTRSIVLALQALQDKIRQLEVDRNFHQDQCEKARQAHESYKKEMEIQLERERAEHRRREDELQELIARANTDRTRLQAALEESKHDIGAFRGELEAVLTRERSDATQKEAQLRQEIESCRSELASQRQAFDQVQHGIEQAKAERDIIEKTNQRLENTIRDLIAMNNGLMQNRNQVVPPAAELPSAPRLPLPERHVDVMNVDSRGVSRGRTPSAHQSRTMRYASPTQSSRARSIDEQLALAAGDPNVKSRQRETAAVRDSTKLENVEALDAVYAELEKERSALNQQYQTVIDRANRPDEGVNPDVLTAQLNHIMVQINRKEEQMRLLRATRLNIPAAAQRATVPRRRTAAQRTKGFEKATKKSTLMNEFRALLNRSVV